MITLVVGDANADLTATLTRFPHEGDDSTVTSLAWGSGGSAANAAVALARLGAPARLLARVGADPAAEVALAAARAADVDLAAVQVDPQLATGLCYAAISPGGERTFLAYRGANVALTLGGGLGGATWLHLSGHALIEGEQRATALALLAEARAIGAPASLDLCLPLLRARREEVLALLPGLAALFANAEELQALAGLPRGEVDIVGLARLAGGLREAHAPASALLIAAKCGAAGCAVVGAGGARVAPGFAVGAVDSNGCGDAFAAGFLAALARGEGPGRCAEVGNACGALAATRPGAAESLPDAPALAAFLAGRGLRPLRPIEETLR